MFFFCQEERFLTLFHLFFSLIIIALGQPFILLINNLLLLANLKRIAESRTSIIGARGIISSVEIQSAKDLVVLAFITIGLSSPLMIWPVILILDCMLYYLLMHFWIGNSIIIAILFTMKILEFFIFLKRSYILK